MENRTDRLLRSNVHLLPCSTHGSDQSRILKIIKIGNACSDPKGTETYYTEIPLWVPSSPLPLDFPLPFLATGVTWPHDHPNLKVAKLILLTLFFKFAKLHHISSVTLLQS